MYIFTRRNAVLGWLVYRIARRKAKQTLRQRVGSMAGGAMRRRGLLAGLGLTAGAVVTGLAVWGVRRGHGGQAAQA